MVNGIEASVEPARNPQYDSAMLVDCKDLEIPGVFFQSSVISLSEVRSQKCQLLENYYPTSIEDSLAADPEKRASTYVVAGDLYG